MQVGVRQSPDAQPYQTLGEGGVARPSPFAGLCAIRKTCQPPAQATMGEPGVIGAHILEEEKRWSSAQRTWLSKCRG